MSKEIKVEKKTAYATAHLPYGAYKGACERALAHEGTIDKTADGFFKATFSSNKIAKQFAKEHNDAYAQAHAAYVPKSEREPKPTPAPKKETKKTKPATGKGNSNLTGNDWVKANPSCTRAEAAAHGLKGITKQQLKALKVELGVR